MIEEENVQLPFTIKDENGQVLFRDALIFQSVSELRNTSEQERQTLMNARYQAHLDAIEYSANNPSEPEPGGE